MPLTTESPLRLTLGYARQMALWKGVRITVPTSSGLVYVYPEDRGLGLCLRSRPPLKGGQAARPCTPFLLPPEQDGRSSSTTSSCQPGLAGAFPGCACSLASSLWQWTARTVRPPLKRKRKVLTAHLNTYLQGTPAFCSSHEGLLQNFPFPHSSSMQRGFFSHF